MNAARLFQNMNTLVKYYSTKPSLAPILNPKMPNLKMFVNNEWVDSLKPGNFYTPINPTTGKPIAEIQCGSKEDVDRAVEAAKKAFHYSSPWRKMEPSKRRKLLNKMADLMERDAAYLASLETLEVGKVYSTTLVADIFFTAEQFRHCSSWADKLFGQVIPIDGDCKCFTRIEPVGVCGLIAAWNFPTLMNAIKLMSAVVGGNVCVLKPSQHGSLTTLHLVELTREAGFPDGVINLVPGTSETGKIICDHPQVDLISFTGSSSAGQDVYRKGADNMKKLILELAGKSPLVVMEDADMDEAVQIAHTANFHNAGQCCCAGSRVYVQEAIFEEFLKRSVALTKKRKIGNPFDQKTMHGPQATESQLNIVMEMIEKGKAEGATVQCGGNRWGSEGFFVEPTILTDLRDDMFVSREEIFGPVQLIYPFKTLDEVIERANDSQYGLASSICTKNIDYINTFSQCINAGNVWVNCYFGISMQAPFGGIKMSGFGKEGGMSGVKDFMQEKTIHIKSPIKVY